SRRRHTRSKRDWSSDVCSSDLPVQLKGQGFGNPFPLTVKGLGRQLHGGAGNIELLNPVLDPKLGQVFSYSLNGHGTVFSFSLGRSEERPCRERVWVGVWMVWRQ